MKKTTAAVIFPDGSILTDQSWLDLEKQLRADRWNPAGAEKFRSEMARRAKNWSGTRIDTELISKEFFEELERAGLLLIIREEMK